MCARACVRARVHGCVRVRVWVCVLEAGWGLGGMELRVDRNIMIFVSFFVCIIYCRFSYGTCTLYLFVSILALLVLISVLFS